MSSRSCAGCIDLCAGHHITKFTQLCIVSKTLAVLQGGLSDSSAAAASASCNCQVAMNGRKVDFVVVVAVAYLRRFNAQMYQHAVLL